ncbi:acyl-CoA dehydrogenase family protein [Sporichthya brevicatena]|uniref:Acyl-CoA dehydrogenase family protein n=1 Tax=Sporichthya brevicatena TaxID=171442 RepID=A0ABN1GNL3_9ACTN
MDTKLPRSAVEFERVVVDAITSLGGNLTERCAQDPTLREHLVAPMLSALGVFDVDPREDLEQLAVAAAVCRAAGATALPYPVTGALSGPGGAGATVLHPRSPVMDHGDLMGGWTALLPDGTARLVRDAVADSSSLSSPFACHLVLGDQVTADPSTIPYHLLFQSWTVLGAMRAATDASVTHCRDRVQFGRRLADFQAVQFKLADMEVAVAGLDELARFSLFRLASDPQAALPDVLSLRLRMIESSETVFRAAHQLHGAGGFCDETPLSWISRCTLLHRRVPTALAETVDWLGESIEVHGFDGLFAPARVEA